MYKRARDWFKHLSKAGKIGIIGAGIFSLLVVSSALAGPSDQKTAPPCTTSSRTTTETVAIPFDKTQVNDANLDKGKTVVTTAGIEGKKTVTNEVTDYSPAGCKPSTTKFVKEETSRHPVTEVTSVGTKEPEPPQPPEPPQQPPQPNCSPYYSPCVPDVSYDLNCSDVGTRVSVHGGDPYRLDGDHDGIGCESY